MSDPVSTPPRCSSAAAGASPRTLYHAADLAISATSEKLHDLSERGAKGKGGSAGARIVETVDGDTIKVTIGGKERTVRLTGLDTPETKRHGVGVECGGPEASESIAGLLSSGQRVKLTHDPSQDDRDRYGRLLRYVEADGSDVARTQLERGWAEIYVYDSTPNERLGTFKKASASARGQGRGVWGSCGGDFHSGS